jgi:AraC family transcriptional regulator, glycine betaine-responsive activator
MPPARRARRAARPNPVDERRAPEPYRIGFLLVPDFPMMAFAAAIEPLRSANRLTGERRFDWQLFSRDGRPVRASNGIDIAVHGAAGDERPLDLLLVCAGTRDAGEGDPVVLAWLRALARRGTALGGVSLGAYALAHAGLLEGRRCALHWESLDAFADRFSRIRPTTDIFAIDGNRYTCAGGTSALDMMLQVIAQREGRDLANDVSEQFIHSRIRGTRDPQRMGIQSRLGVANEKLIAAVALMEQQSEDPRPVQRIAADVDLSPRQLERLFARYLRTTPAKYYMDLRLARARMLLLETTRPILDVAVGCGFASASHFSRCYRALYGLRPSDERLGKASVKPGRAAQRA